MAYLKSQCREFEKNRSDSSQIPVAEQALKYLMTVIAGKVGGSEEILRMGRNLSHIAMVGRN